MLVDFGNLFPQSGSPSAPLLGARGAAIRVLFFIWQVSLQDHPVLRSVLTALTSLDANRQPDIL